jgi:hypothetical protein
MGTPELKSPLVRHSPKWKFNIKINLILKKRGARVWIYLAEDRVQWQAVVNTVMNLRFP